MTHFLTRFGLIWAGGLIMFDRIHTRGCGMIMDIADAAPAATEFICEKYHHSTHATYVQTKSCLATK